MSVDGTPVCIGIGAHIHFVELKTIGGILSEAQKMEHKALKQAGFVVKVIWTKEQVDQYIGENHEEL